MDSSIVIKSEIEIEDYVITHPSRTLLCNNYTNHKDVSIKSENESKVTNKAEKNQTPNSCEVEEKQQNASEHKSKILEIYIKPTVKIEYYDENNEDDPISNEILLENNVDVIKEDCNKTLKKPYICELCNKGYECARYLTDHIYMHSGLKPYTCKLCTKQFSHASGFSRHMKKHTGGRTFICKVCNKTYTRGDTLSNHMRRAHTGENPLVCKYCSRKFTHRNRLLVHVRHRHAIKQDDS